MGEDRAVRPAGAGPAEIDSKFLESLRKDPAYSGIDVDRELGKCRRWCEVHRKVASRRRFVSWLNRIEKPMDDSVGCRKLTEVQENLQAPLL